MKRVYFILLAVVMTISATAKELRFPLEDGTKICFIGNSITQDGRYHKILNTHYATRYPGSDVWFISCGIGGDTATGMIARFEDDILIHNPDYAFLMTGMNDMSSALYTNGIEVTEELMAKRKANIERYKREVVQLVDMMEEHDIVPILMTPTIYDQTAKLDTPPLTGKNDALGLCAQFIRELAKERGLQLVDHYDIMMSINQQKQSVDPEATIVGSDRVHPQNEGHFVMAYNILNVIENRGVRSAINIDYRKAKVAEATNCTVDKVERDRRKGELTFQVDLKALPMPKIAGFNEMNEYLPFAKEFCRDMLYVGSLPEGSYNLYIDDVSVSEFSSQELCDGVDLSSYPNTPQNLQSQEILDFINRYSSIQGSLRLISNVEHRMLTDYKGGESLDERVEYLDELIESNRGGQYYNNQLRQRGMYIKLKPDQQRYIDEFETLHREKVSTGAAAHNYTYRLTRSK